MDKQIYNIGIVAHVDAGKTTLTEQFLVHSGAIRKAGSVDNGTTQTDWMPIEKERGISVKSAQTTFTYCGKQINLIDTPGHIDFASEVERSLVVLDIAVLVISAVEGIQAHTENLWNAIRKLRIPTVVFINKIDRAGSHYFEIIQDIKDNLDTSDLSLCAMSDIKNEGLANFEITRPSNIRDRIVEGIIDHDDEIAEMYINGNDINDDVLLASFRKLIAKCKIVPVFAGCAQKDIGVTELLDCITTCYPSADQKSTDNLSAMVFGITHDASMGKIAHVRLYGGSLKNRDSIVFNGETATDKISQIRKFNGQKYVDVGAINAGDIGALCGLNSAKVYSTIGDCAISDTYRLANPFLAVKASPKDETKLTELINALTELSDEDPLLSCKWEKSEREIVLSITGQIQLEVISALLKDRYNLEAIFSTPSVIYKETPAKEGYGFEAYTMPKPCWAVVKLHFEPLPRGSGVIYDPGNVPSNTCFYRYQEHIKRSFYKNLDQGMLGWEVTDFKATLDYAEHHTMHTHPLDFFVATPMAIMDGLRNTGTKLLEPIMKVKITAPSDVLGKVIGDITNMRGEFDSPVIKGDTFTVEALLPVATSIDYNIKLASQTHGKGIIFSKFDSYKECPLELGATAKRRGPNPLDRAKWILYARGAMTDEDYSII